MTVTRIIAIVAALLVAVQVVRNAAVVAFAETRPDAAARLWSDHPDVERSLAMTRIARAARSGRPVPASVFSTMGDVARKAPLAPEPFLVKGVEAQLAGEPSIAQRAFEAAQWRDPRSLPAAYFLADRYFRIGDADRGLREIAALARLSPNGSAIIGPYLAAYAASPANWPALRRLFRANPALADPALTALARNIATVPAVLALAEPRHGVEPSNWLGPLLETLTAAGQYQKARAIWGQAAGASGREAELLYDSGFSDKSAPPPFNWTLASSTVGLAERQPGGRLHVVFYGQEDGMLASQLLLLPPGAYRLSMKLLGDPARARVLNWSIWCDKADSPIASASLDAVTSRGWSFVVPAGCAAQWLKLSGSSNDLPQESDVTIAALKLERAAPGG
jgi:hypothetical protein